METIKPKRPRIGQARGVQTPMEPRGVVRGLKWKAIETYVRNGIGVVYWNTQEIALTLYRNRIAAINSQTGELLEINCDSQSFPMHGYYLVLNADTLPKPVVTGDRHLSIKDSYHADAKQVHRAHSQRRETLFAKGQTHPSPKRQGKANSHDDIGKYVNKRRAFSVDEYAAICERFKRMALERSLEVQAKARVK